MWEARLRNGAEETVPVPCYPYHRPLHVFPSGARVVHTPTGREDVRGDDPTFEGPNERRKPEAERLGGPRGSGLNASETETDEICFGIGEKTQHRH